MTEALQQEIRTLRSLYKSQRDPEGRVFASLADAHRRAGQLSEASQLLEEGLGRHQDFVPGHVVAAQLFLQQGLTEEAGLAARRALELDGENVNAMVSLLRVLELEGDASEAEAVRERLLSLEPDFEAGEIWAAAQPGTPSAPESAPAASAEGPAEGPPDAEAGPLLMEPIDISLVGFEVPAESRRDLQGDEESAAVRGSIEEEPRAESAETPEGEPKAEGPDSMWAGGFAGGGLLELDAADSLEEREPKEPVADLDTPVTDAEAVLAAALTPDEPTIDLDVLAPVEPLVDLEDFAREEDSLPDVDLLGADERIFDLDDLAPEEETVVDVEALALEELVVEATELVFEEDVVVDIEALALEEPVVEAAEPAPEEDVVVDIEALAPEELIVEAAEPALEEYEVVDIEALAPEELIVEAAEPAPEEDEVVDIEALAPEEPVVEAAEPAPEEDEVVDIEALAPEEPVVEAAEPAPEEDEVVGIEALAPEEPVVEAAEPAPEEDEVVDIEAPDSEPDEETGPPIYTRTLAELYVEQGAIERALEVFRRVREADPTNEEIARRIAQLESDREEEVLSEPVGEPAQGDEESDAHVEALARDLAESGDSDHDVESPFSWAGHQGEERAPDEPTMGDYFDGLLSWNPKERA